MANDPQQIKPQGAQQTPRYKITEKCYIDDRYLDPETQPVDPQSEDGERRPLIIEFKGPPAYYMEPVNDAARAMVAKANPGSRQFVDPIEKMAQIN